jgi:hypothetical protein
LLAAAAVVIVVLLAVVAVVRRPTPGPDHVSVATTSLADLAAVARSTPAKAIPPGNYLHTQVETGVPSSPDASTAVRNDMVTEGWLDATGTGLQKTGDRVPSYLAGSAGSSTTLGPTSQAYAPADRDVVGYFTADELQHLPTDATGLRAALVTALGPHANPSDSAVITGLAIDIAALPIAPAGVRAAVMDLLATEGFVAVGERADHDGRVGAGFDLVLSDTTVEVVLDQTAVPLGREQVVTSPGAVLVPAAPVGAVVRFSVYQKAEVVPGPLPS